MRAALTFAIVLSMFCTAFAGAATSVDPPLPIKVHLRDKSSIPDSNGLITGQLTQYDEESITVTTDDKPLTLSWAQVTSTDAYALRYKLIRPSQAADWLALGRFGWSIGSSTARSALRKAVSLDSALQEEVDSILQTEPGELVRQYADQSKSQEHPDDNANPSTEPADESSQQKDDNGHDSNEKKTPKKDADKDTDVVEYQPVTPEEANAAIEKYRADARAAAQKLGIDFQELQTPNFLIFTDWDPREFDFLRTNLQDAYTVVSRQFGLSPKGNIFVGKLPVYMLSERDTFRRFASQIDHTGSHITEGAAGYYYGWSNGMGHLVMWKPDLYQRGAGLQAAKIAWAKILTHEFTHAFVARYRSNRHIPSWLNEGIAETTAAKAFPDPQAILRAQQIARSGFSVSVIFEPGAPPFELYPVMRTMTEMLIASNPRSFQRMFDEIKDGTAAEEALKKYYKVDYAGLENAWRQWIVQLKKPVIPY